MNYFAVGHSGEYFSFVEDSWKEDPTTYGASPESRELSATKPYGKYADLGRRRWPVSRPIHATKRSDLIHIMLLSFRVYPEGERHVDCIFQVSGFPGVLPIRNRGAFHYERWLRPEMGVAPASANSCFP